MLTFAYGILAGILAVVVVTYVMLTIRRRKSPIWHLFTLALVVQVSYALAALLYFPATETMVAQITGITPLSLWASNMCSLVSASCCLLFFRRLVYGREPSLRLFWIRLAATMSIMTVCLILAGSAVSADGQPFSTFSAPLLVYRLVDILYLGYCEVRLMRLWHAQVRLSKDIAFRLGLVLFLAGSSISFFWLLLNVPLALTPLKARDAAILSWWYSATFTMMSCCFMLGGLLPLVGMRTGALGSPWRAVTAYYRLQPLWHDLTRTVPQVVLPLTIALRDAIWRGEDLDLLLYRRVIEMLDAWRHLGVTIQEDSPAALTAAERACWRARAHEDAQVTWFLLSGKESSSATTLHLPSSYIEQVKYLEAVSQAYRRRKQHSLAQARRSPSLLPKGSIR